MADDSTHTSEEGGAAGKKIDLEDLLERNSSLADLVKTLQLSNTWRDNPEAIAEDLSIALKARDESSDIGKAFVAFEATLEGREDIGAKTLSRKELAARLTAELQPPSE